MAVNLCILSIGDPTKSRRWSGSASSIMAALSDYPGQVSVVAGEPLNLLARGVNRLLRLIGVDADIRYAAWFARLGGAYCAFRLSRIDADLVVAIAASSYIAYLKTNKPIIHLSDTTFAAISRMYPRYLRFPPWLRADGERVEVLALAKASLIVLPSRWARDSAIADYGVAPGKILLAPFGPNLPDAVLKVRPTPKSLPKGSPLRILHVSADWERKGGRLVVEIIRLLRERGVDARATLVGDIPPGVELGPWIESVGWIRKEDPRDIKKLAHLYDQAHISTLPTSAECYGAVFSEAQAFGCPSVAYDVGGTSDALGDGRCGALIPLGAPASAFADAIEALIENPIAYAALSRGCRDHFEARANWPTYVHTVLARALAPVQAPSIASSSSTARWA